MGMESCSSPYNYIRYETRRQIEPFDAAAADVETLPLFPMHGDEHNNRSSDDATKAEHPVDCFSGWYLDVDEERNKTSLELCLNSYSDGAPDVTWPRP